MKTTIPFNPIQRAITASLFRIILLMLLTAGVSYGQELYINVSGPLTASPGELLTYTITFANNGTAQAQDVFVTHQLPDPALYSFVSAQSVGGAYDYSWSGNSLVWDIGTLGGGLKQLVVQIRAGKPGAGPNQDPSGYYMPGCGSFDLLHSLRISSTNYSEATDSHTTVATQTAGATMDDRLGSIKPGNGSTTRYLMIVVNTGNYIDKFTLSQADVDCTPWGYNNTNRDIPGFFYDLNGNTITETEFIQPGGQYLFYYELAVNSPPNANAYDCKNVCVISKICSYTQCAKVVTWVRNLNAPNLDVSKSDNPDPVYSGEFLTYTIFVYNSGKGTANTVTLTETYPAQVTFVSATPAPTTGNHIWSLPDIPEAGFQQITITVRVNNGLANGTILTNTVTARYFNGTTLMPLSTDTETTTVRSIPDVKITKTANPASVDPGGMITYTLFYENIGNAAATGVSIEDDYNETYLDVINAAGGDYTTTPGIIKWNIGTLATGASGTITYTLQAKDLSNFTAGTTTILNTAEIFLNETDENYGNNFDEAIVQVTVLPDLYVTKTADPNPAEAGQTLEYTITWGNSGEVAHSGHDYVITDYLPAGTVLLNPESLPNGGVYDEGEHKIIWTFSASLGVNASLSMKITLDEIDCDLVGEQLENKVTIWSAYYSDANDANNEYTLYTDVEDNTPPEIECPIFTDNTVTVDATSGTIYIHSGIAWDATATDNCTEIPTIGYELSGVTSGSGSSLAGVSFNEGTTTVTWTATDESGNTATCSFTVVVNAKADLEITKTASVMGTGDDEGKAIGVAGGELTYTITVTNHGPSIAKNVVISDDVSGFWSDAMYATGDAPTTWLDWESPFEYEAGDLLKDASVIIYIKGTFALDQCEDVTNVASVSSDNDDIPGNNTATLYTIVLDETDPEWAQEMPEDVTVVCDEVPAVPDISATDNCDTDVFVEYSQTGSYNACGGELTRTWIATDNSQNSITHVQTITVSPAPQAAFVNPPANTTISCNEATAFTASNLGYTNSGLGGCLIEGQVLGIITGTYDECGGTLTQTWTFVDDCDRQIQ
ncbi:MAG: HYR domain-containing protein, partial [Bacteroidota bacterium]